MLTACCTSAPTPEHVEIPMREKAVVYVFERQEDCDAIYFVCEAHEESFYNDRGCGCIEK